MRRSKKYSNDSDGKHKKANKSRFELNYPTFKKSEKNIERIKKKPISHYVRWVSIISGKLLFYSKCRGRSISVDCYSNNLCRSFYGFSYF